MRSERAGNQGFVEEIRQAVWSVNSNLPVATVQTMQEVYDKSVARTSFTLVMLGIAGAMSLPGDDRDLRRAFVHGVAAAARDWNSAGAGGAERKRVGNGVESGAKMALAGVAIGVVVALGLTRWMGNLLFGVSAHDPLTFATVAASLTVVAMVAC